MFPIVFIVLWFQIIIIFLLSTVNTRLDKTEEKDKDPK